MTAKEKAKSLVYSFYCKTDSLGLMFCLNYSNAKQCALICVDEILELDVVWYDEELVKDYPKTYKPNQTIEYWEQVKSEIQKL